MVPRQRYAGLPRYCKSHGKELPDRTFEEAGRLAAYYSKGKNAPKVEIDYTLRKNLKKPTGGQPGFVVYYTNYSMMSRPDISGIREADQYPLILYEAFSGHRIPCKAHVKVTNISSYFYLFLLLIWYD